MKTNELIALLASDPLPSRPPAWHLPLAATVALGLSLAMVVGGWGLHADLRGLVASASYQLKTVWLLGLALSSGTLVWRLARPAERDGYAMHGIGVFLLIMACTGAYNLWQAEPANRLALLMGQSWWSCPLSIALIALPWLAVWLLYLRHMAPTRLTWSGASAGFLSGALATGLYSLHCAETSYAFFSAWYVAGMGLSTAMGAFLGPRYLRW
jgi:hypothetical protein